MDLKEDFKMFFGILLHGLMIAAWTLYFDIKIQTWKFRLRIWATEDELIMLEGYYRLYNGILTNLVKESKEIRLSYGKEERYDKIIGAWKDGINHLKTLRRWMLRDKTSGVYIYERENNV